MAEIVAVRRGAAGAAKAAAGGMKFGAVPLEEARGAIMAHSQRVGERMVRKGSVLDEDALIALREAGREEVIVARLEPGDVPEDIAADRLAQPLVSPLLARTRAATGRVNLAADAPGLLRVDAAMINRLNTIDESLTIGTLPDYAVVAQKDLVATVKIIPFSVPGNVLAVAEALVRQAGSPLTLHPFHHLKVGLVVTELPGLKDSVTEKTIAATEQRITAAYRFAAAAVAFASRRSADWPRRWNGWSPTGAELLLVVGASAVVDRRDVGPAGDRACGRRDPAFRNAGRSRQPDLPRPDRHEAGAGAARLRAQPEAERHRLRADPAVRQASRLAAPKSCRWASAAC